MTPYILHDAPQRSDQWYRDRLGHLTSSVAADILAKGRGGAESTTRQNLLVQLAVERLTGSRPPDGYVNAAMEYGTSMEPAARFAYEAETGRIVQEGGFAASREVPWLGASVDGFVGREGIIEIKCPFVPARHAATYDSLQVPKEYMPQVVHQLAVTGAEWCDYVSYSPAFPAHMRLVILRVNWEQKAISAYLDAVNAFLADVEAKVEHWTEGERI